MVTRVLVLQTDSMRLTPLTIVHHQWIVTESEVLSHAQHDDCYLRFRPQAPYGGVVLFSFRSVETFSSYPWWISRTTTRLDTVCVGDVTGQGCREVTLDPIRLTVRSVPCKRPRTLLEQCEKSARSVGVDCPLIHGLASTDFKAGRLEYEGIAYETRRIVTKDEAVRSGLYDLFYQSFKKDYVDQLLSHCAEDPWCLVVGVFRGKCLVGAFVMILFDAIFSHEVCSDSTSTGATGRVGLIDTFAVDKDSQSSGIGSVIFHEVCRRLTREDHRPRHLMLAQCLRTPGPKLFWWDKLDETSVARGVLWQAYEISQGRIILQGEKECSIRAREYSM